MIDLLVALSLIALITAGVMLAASARAEVQRRLGAIGVRRAVGTSRGQVTLAQGLEALLVAVPAASLGLAAGVLAAYGPSSRLLELLNEPAPRALWSCRCLEHGSPPCSCRRSGQRGRRGAPVAVPSCGCSAGATSRTGSRIGSGTRLARPLPRRERRPHRARGPARRGPPGAADRDLCDAGPLAGFVLLMLALASTLSSLETDPSALGKRYQMTAPAPLSLVPRIARIPGVQDAAPRFEVEGRTRTRSVRRSTSSPTPATTHCSRRRSSWVAAGCAVTARRRSATASPRPWG